MRVAEVHPQYIEYCDDWQTVYDCLREKRVKDAKTTYLNRTGGQAHYKLTNGNDDPYEFYLDRARFPSLVSSAVTALTGIAHRLPFALEAPERFIGMSEVITPNAENLEELSRKVVRHTLLDGRYGLLSDVDSEGNPNISTYSALSIKDWRCMVIGGRKVLTYVKLEEEIDASEEDFIRDLKKQYRVLRLVDGFYEVTIYDESNNPIGEPLEPRKANKQRLDYIPFVFVGSIDLTPDCDESPMQPLARTALNIYKLDAVYMQSLYMTGEPTPWIASNSKDTPKSIGSSTIWTLPENSKVGYLEFTGAGIEAQRIEINDEYARAAKIGGELSQTSGQAESGEAIKLRMFSRHATLFSVAQVGGAGMNQSLKWCADMVGIDSRLIEFKPNLDFTSAEITDALINVFNNGVLAGTIAQSVLNDALRDGGYTDKTDEEISDEIEQGGMIAPMVDNEPE